VQGATGEATQRRGTFTSADNTLPIIPYNSLRSSLTSMRLMCTLLVIWLVQWMKLCAIFAQWPKTVGQHLFSSAGNTYVISLWVDDGSFESFLLATEPLIAAFISRLSTSCRLLIWQMIWMFSTWFAKSKQSDPSLSAAR
jgi:hypothetical protein